MFPALLKGNVKRLFCHSEVCTIPNLLSLFRILLIPVLYYYCRVRPVIPAAAGTLVLSCLTDILDGYIARRFRQVSDLGKILDPLADKLTQLILLISLIRRHWAIVPLLVLFCIKEIFQATLRYLVLRNCGEVHSAEWFGKLSTALLLLVMGILIVFPDLSDLLASLMILICAVMLLFAMIRYTALDLSILKAHSSRKVHV